jgi:hypothetical protein
VTPGAAIADAKAKAVANIPPGGTPVGQPTATDPVLQFTSWRSTGRATYIPAPAPPKRSWWPWWPWW